MPIKRRVPKCRQRVTPEAVAAFVAGDWRGLYRALGLRPWQAHPLDVDGPRPDWARGIQAESWDQALALRAELQAAAKVRRGGERIATPR